MRIAFLSEAALVDSLGMEYLYTYLANHGHDAHVFFDLRPFDVREYPLMAPASIKRLVSMSASDHARRIVSTGAEVVCFSAVTDWYRSALAVATELKRLNPDIRTIFGGPHVSEAVRHVVAEDCVDYACVGEGEIALVKLVCSLESGDQHPDIPGVYFRKGGNIAGSGSGELIRNLDDLPVPDKRPVYRQLPYLQHVYTIMTGRGCYYKCTFCSSPFMRQVYRAGNEQFLRRRSVDHVIRELSEAKRAWPRLRYVFFADDTFVQDRVWMAEFASAYRKHVGLPFWAQTIATLKDEPLVRELARAGWINVELGVQSADETIRSKILLRPETNAQIAESVRLLKAAGVYVNIDHIVGLPTDSVDVLRRAVEYYNRVRPDWLNVFSLKYYPGTALALDARRRGELSDAQLDEIGRGHAITASGRHRSYLRGGDTDTFRRFGALMTLMTMLPFLPRRWVERILRSHRLQAVLNWIPNSVFLLSRTVRGLTERRDFIARVHLRIVMSIFWLAIRQKYSSSWRWKAFLPRKTPTVVPVLSIESAPPTRINFSDRGQFEKVSGHTLNSITHPPAGV